MRWLVAVAVIGGALMSGCSATAGSVDQDEMETAIAKQLEKTVGQAPESVECPDALEPSVDASVRCTLTADDGTQIGLTVTVTGVDGTDVDFDIMVDDEPK